MARRTVARLPRPRCGYGVRGLARLRQRRHMRERGEEHLRIRAPQSNNAAARKRQVSTPFVGAANGSVRVSKATSILVVDDNPALRETIARSLTRRGYQVTIAFDAVEGLERLQGAVFDVVITDLQGRERGGLWLFRQTLGARPQLT